MQKELENRESASKRAKKVIVQKGEIYNSAKSLTVDLSKNMDPNVVLEMNKKKLVLLEMQPAG
jgi:hypothetical protein